MTLRPTHPLRLVGIVVLGGMLPLFAVAGLLLAGVWWVNLAFGAGDVEYLLYPGGLCLWTGIVGALWLLRTSPLPLQSPTPPEAVPALMDLVDRTTEGVQGMKARRIWVHRGFQVNLQTRPVFGPLGWASHGWALGVFSLMHYTPRELEAALLWDQAFWSRQHSWLNLEAKRILQFWRDLGQAVAQNRAPILGWTNLLPRLGKPLSAWGRWIERMGGPFLFDQVLMADRSVGKALGGYVTAQMLTKEALTAFQIDGLWYGRWFEALEAVPNSPLAEAQAYLKRWPGPEVDVRLEALVEGDVSGVGAFRLRMESLGVSPEVPRPPQESAWERFLQVDALEQVDGMDGEWREVLGLRRTERSQRSEQARARYAEWRARDATDPLPDDYAPEMAQLALEHGTEAEARTWLDRWMAAEPKSGDAKAAHCRFLLKSGDPEGLEALERLRELHPLNASAVANLWADHLERIEPGSGAALEARRRAYRAGRIYENAVEERRTVGLKDVLLPHEASESDLATIRAWLNKVQGLSRAYLVRKEVHHHPESPLYLMVVVHKDWLRSVLRPAELGRWQSQILQTLPSIEGARLFLLVLRGVNRYREGRVRRLGSALIRR